jgi:hypothetical protein
MTAPNACGEPVQVYRKPDSFTLEEIRNGQGLRD